MLPSDRNKPASGLFVPDVDFHLGEKYCTAIRKARSQPFVIMRVRSPARMMALSRKNFLTCIFMVFMFYVVICLQELRRNVHIILEPHSPSTSVSRISTSSQSSQTEIYRIVGENGQNSVAREGDALHFGSVKTFTLHTASLTMHDQSGNEPNRESITPLQLNDLHISVKTSKKFHRQRLDIILQTWFKYAKNQTYFVTDEQDGEFQLKTDGHLIISSCSNSHHRKALCCKMAMELDFFSSLNKKWFCHFDDDNYVNVWNLLDMLRGYDYTGQWYLGKTSIKAPIEISHLKSTGEDQNAAFWFATGGAGFCLSHGLVEKMKPLTSGGKFMSIGEKIRLPDDVTIGYIVEHLLKVPLTIIERFHSHLEPLYLMDLETLKTQISFGYSTYRGNQMNRVSVSGWNSESDPTRFLSLDCLLRPDNEKGDCPTVTVSV
ncbi:fringe glycosyltransferase-like [Paramacrobiotus metropolitanus]|uniref:fringe glycosyltransferase-like n=1 Tax=Paramacrobiotus metropolitanus TaxID=2943436 RepID=UPI002445C89F|nr:fringe glycosyltransferase-like [Paramacrobiotus metropolitanus]